MFLLRGQKQKFPHWIIACILLFVSSCDSGVKPNYFIGMFRDEGDIDRLSACLSAIPEIDADGNIIIKADSQCLTDLSKRDTSDPNMHVSFTEILNDPEQFLDKIVIFQAVIKTLHGSHGCEVYTNRKEMSFHITSHGAEIHILDEEGEEQDLIPNQVYTLTCRIYEIKINHHGLWHIQSEFIITQDRKKIVHLPVLVNDTE